MADFETYSREHIHFPTGKQMPSLLTEWLKDAEELQYVLDVGCGGGAFLASLSTLNTESVVGVDLAEIRLQRMKRRSPEVAVCVADALALPFAPARIQLAICNQVIEHMASDGALIQELRRILAPGCWLFISSVVKRPWAWYLYRNQDGKVVLDPTHVKEYHDREEFLQVLNLGGFTVTTCKMEGFSYPAVDLIARLLIRLRLVTLERVCWVFEHSPFLQRLRTILALSVPGYYQMSAMARKE